MIIFDINKMLFGCCIRMLCDEFPYVYNYNDEINDYLQINHDDFEKSLNSYNGYYYNVGDSSDVFILHFDNKEDAERFIKEYLEPQLIAKELSK